MLSPESILAGQKVIKLCSACSKCENKFQSSGNSQLKHFTTGAVLL